MNSQELVIRRISQQLNTSRLWSKYIGPACVLAAFAAGWWAYRYKGLTTYSAPYYVAAIVLLFSGAGFMAMAIPARKYQYLLDAAQHTPETIVWIYQLIITRNGVPGEVMVLGDDRGRLVYFPLKRREGRQDDLMNAFVHLFSKAIVGYSEERKRLFRKDPAQFCRQAASLA